MKTMTRLYPLAAVALFAVTLGQPSAALTQDASAVVTVEVEGIGTLTTPFKALSEKPPSP